MGRGRPRAEGGSKQDFFLPRTPGRSDGSTETTVPPMDPVPSSSSDISHLTAGEKSIMAAIQALHDKSDRIEAKITHLEHGFETLNAKVANLDLKTSAIEKRIDTHDKDIQEIITKQKEVQLSYQASVGDRQRLVRRLEVAENMLRETHIRILGVPPAAEKEDMVSFVASLLVELLDLQGEEESFYVVKAFRLPSRRSNVGEPSGGTILAVLSDSAERDFVLAKARKKKELFFMNQRILLFPDVSPSAQERKMDMLKLRRQLADQNIEAAILYPAKLRIRHKGKQYVFSEVQAAKAFVDTLEGV